MAREHNSMDVFRWEADQKRPPLTPYLNKDHVSYLAMTDGLLPSAFEYGLSKRPWTPL